MIPAYSRINPNRKASTLPAHKDLYIRVKWPPVADFYHAQSGHCEKVLPRLSRS